MSEFEVRQETGADGSRLVRLSGRLIARDAGRLRRELQRLAAQAKGVLSVDLSEIREFDGTVAAVLVHIERLARETESPLRIVGAQGVVGSILELYSDREPRDCAREAPHRIGILDQIGGATLDFVYVLRGSLDYFGKLIRAIAAAFRWPRTVHWPDVPLLMERSGADSLPIVSTINLLIGLTAAYQAAVQLRTYGADIFVADLVGLSITRELGPLMTAIVVTGRSGAAYAAEIGTMKVSEEIDALQSMRLCPFRFLVIPRAIALVAMMPLLTMVADLMGIIGGYLISISVLDVTTRGYWTELLSAVELWDVGGGLIKSVVFGLLISLIACERGLATKGGAEGVGRSTTSAVVVILFNLIAADALFAILYERLGI